jgi:hypothetical protein
MDPIKAAKLGVDPEEVQISCQARKYRGSWVLWVPRNEGEIVLLTDPKIEEKRVILTSGELHDMCWWLAQLRLVLNGVEV